MATTVPKTLIFNRLCSEFTPLSYKYVYLNNKSLLRFPTENLLYLSMQNFGLN